MQTSSTGVPRHIGIILDGNRRWAKEQGLPTLEGHRRGYEKLKEVGEWALEAGVKYLTVFGFSTENWKRSAEEVGYLMRLFYDALLKEIEFFVERGLRLRVIGRREGLPAELVQAFVMAEEKTRHLEKGTLTLAINYGGRQAIVDACRAAMRSGLAPEQLGEAEFAMLLQGEAIPDPDLVMRTSGEQRLSGFLPWESTYAELYFTPVYWPALTRDDFRAALVWYAGRERRLGK